MRVRSIAKDYGEKSESAKMINSEPDVCLNTVQGSLLNKGL